MKLRKVLSSTILGMIVIVSCLCGFLLMNSGMKVNAESTLTNLVYNFDASTCVLGGKNGTKQIANDNTFDKMFNGDTSDGAELRINHGALQTNGANSDVFITIDLGAVYNIKHFYMFSLNRQNAGWLIYNLSVSNDGVTFTKITDDINEYTSEYVTTSNSSSKTASIDISGEGRYFKIDFVGIPEESTGAGQWMIRIYELELYGYSLSSQNYIIDTETINRSTNLVAGFSAGTCTLGGANGTKIINNGDLSNMFDGGTDYDFDDTVEFRINADSLKTDGAGKDVSITIDLGTVCKIDRFYMNSFNRINKGWMIYNLSVSNDGLTFTKITDDINEYTSEYVTTVIGSTYGNKYSDIALSAIGRYFKIDYVGVCNESTVNSWMLRIFEIELYGKKWSNIVANFASETTSFVGGNQTKNIINNNNFDKMFNGDLTDYTETAINAGNLKNNRAQDVGILIDLGAVYNLEYFYLKSFNRGSSGWMIYNLSVSTDGEKFTMLTDDINEYSSQYVETSGTVKTSKIKISGIGRYFKLDYVGIPDETTNVNTWMLRIYELGLYGAPVEYGRFNVSGDKTVNNVLSGLNLAGNATVAYYRDGVIVSDLSTVVETGDIVKITDNMVTAGTSVATGCYDADHVCFGGNYYVVTSDVVAVENEIEALASSVTAASAGAIASARADYDALGFEEKSSIYNHIDLFDSEIVLQVVNAIETIGEVTSSSGSAIMSARTFYDALSSKLQARVGNYSTLTVAETIYPFERDSESFALTMRAGASIRYSASETGIRFMEYFDKTTYENLISEGYEVTLGMLIAPYDYISMYGALTLETISSFSNVKNIVADSEKIIAYGDMLYVQCALTNILDNNLTREFEAIGYVTFTKDDVSVTKYATNCENAVRSIYYVAVQVLADENETKTEAMINILNSFITTVQDKFDYEIVDGVAYATLKDGISNTSIYLPTIYYNYDDETIYPVAIAGDLNLVTKATYLKNNSGISISADNTLTLIVENDYNEFVRQKTEKGSFNSSMGGTYSSENHTVNVDGGDTSFMLPINISVIKSLTINGETLRSVVIIGSTDITLDSDAVSMLETGDNMIIVNDIVGNTFTFTASLS